MGCKCARVTDEFHGWECDVSGGACMFVFPDSKRCAKEFGEGPDADFNECNCGEVSALSDAASKITN